jgi:hypothetical protein
MRKFPLFWFVLKQRKILFFKTCKWEGKRFLICLVGTGRSGEDIKKGYRKVNMVKILSTHV